MSIKNKITNEKLPLVSSSFYKSMGVSNLLRFMGIANIYKLKNDSQLAVTNLIIYLFWSSF